MIALKWDDKTSQFIAKYEDKSSKSGFILKHDLSLDFLEEILDPLFVHLVMQTPKFFLMSLLDQQWMKVKMRKNKNI